MSSDRVCSECIHAALDSSGVYCKLFHEAILNERVAEECGEFERDDWPDPAARQRPVLVALPSNGWKAEQERTVSVEVHVDFFGREEIADRIVKNLEREVACTYGERARVKRI